MQPCCPFPIVAVGYKKLRYKQAVAVEQLVHRKLKSTWRHCEWFAATEEEVLAAIKESLAKVAEVGEDMAHRVAHSWRFMKKEDMLSL